MRSFTLAAYSSLAATAAAVTGELGDAAVIRNNPIGASYYAYFPNSAEQPIRGSIVASTAAASGVGVNFAINIANLPIGKGPFTYHIHDQPVAASGDCDSTLEHLDPYIRGPDPPCDPSQPQTCQVGDLSGKHGSIGSSSFVAAYTDLYASVKPGIGAFLGNRSVVVHDKDSNRLTCANFAVNSAGYYPSWNGTYTNGTIPPPYPTGGTPTYLPTNTPPVPTYAPPTASPTGSATTLMVSTGAILAAAMAMFL